MVVKQEVLERVRALLSRAVDPGASKEEQRTSAHIAAILCRDHGITVAVEGRTVDPTPPPDTRSRAEVVADGARAVRAGLDEVLGFDVAHFAQQILRDRLAPRASQGGGNPPAPRRARPRKR